MINIEFSGPEQKRKAKIVKAKQKQVIIVTPEEKSKKQEGTPVQTPKPSHHHIHTTDGPKRSFLEQAREWAKLILNMANPEDYTTKEQVITKKKVDELESQEEEIEIIRQTDFLNTAEYQELKDKYTDYNIGELVLQFPNPDYEQLQDRGVDIREALDVFNNQLAVIAEGGIPQSQLILQKKAFLAVYLQLDDFIDEKKQKASIRKSQSVASPTTNPDLMQLTIYKEKYKVYQEMSKEELLKFQQDEISKKTQKIQIDQTQTQQINLQNNIPEKPIETNKGQENNEEQKDGEYSKINVQVDELIKLIRFRPQDNTNSYFSLKKKLCKGGFLYKKWTEDKSDYDWIQVGQQPNDFLTLIRHTVITKLSRDAHFHCRQFISSDDRFIFVVLKSKLEAIKHQAELQRMQKQYELGFADILSLEPCDKLLRPLRLKNYLRDPDFIKEAPSYIEDKEQNKSKKLARIDSEAQKIYQNTLKWGDQELRAHCVLKQVQLDQLINTMAKKLKTNLNSERLQILDDRPLSRDVWEAYHIYQLYLIDYLQRVFDGFNYEEIQANKGFLFKLIFRKAIGDSNEFYQAFNSGWFKEKLILANLWDRQGLNPIAPYEQYFVTRPNEGLWRQYEVSEKGHRSEFMNMEKIKISCSTLTKYLNIKKLIEKKYITSFFALHDPYQLMGLSKGPMIKPLADLQLVKEPPKTIGQLKLNDLFVSLKDEAEGADFDNDCLLDECRFKWCPPWQLPIDSMRDYYGEKIALYFRFLQYYTQQLWNIVVLAIICEGVIDNTTGDVKKAFIIIFSVLLISWSSYFLAHWKRQQTMFQIEFGQNVQTEANEIERPAFEGNFVRSIVTDKLNEEYYPGWKKQLTLIYSSSITLLMVSVVIGSVIGVFFLKNYFYENYPDNQFLISFVPSIINALAIQIFNVVYYSVANSLNEFENHKYQSSYENSFIVKNYTFIFITTFNCLALIAFLNNQFPNLSLCKTSDGVNCYKALKDQMVTIFMVNFAKTLPQLIVPCLKTILRSETKKADDNPVSHEFNQIDEFIERQADLEPYISNQEVDGLMNDYMELTVQFAFLQLFGLAFPLSYFIAFITNLTQIQVDKLKLIHFMQRPLPTAAANIGQWDFIMDIVAFLSVFCNAGLIVFTSGAVDQDFQTGSYAIFVIIFLGLKYFSQFIISPIPERAQLILTRHKFAIDRVHKGMKNSSKSYFEGKLRSSIEGVDYNKMTKKEQDHVLLGPKVKLIK